MKKQSGDLSIVLGQIIRARREELEITQASLAQMTRLNRNYIGMIERAERNLTVLSLVAIADSLETTGHKLLAKAEKAMK